jgi:TIR domain/WD domain, G-beta repeat
MNVANNTYDVFISYSRADSRHAAEIDAVLRASGLRPFFDRRNLSPGLPWLRALEQAVSASKAAIVLIGPRGLGNTQQYERELALVRQTHDPAFPVVPVILPEAQIDRPFNFLNILTWIDFSPVPKVSDAPADLERLVEAVKGRQISSGARVRETICPYRGLDAFREEDSACFFGRGSSSDPESPIGQLVRAVCDRPFVMVVGRSGSGKSSLVYAGLLPALRRAKDRFWNVITLRPGPEPLRALAAAFNPRSEEIGAAEYATKVGAEAEQLRSGDPDLLSHMIREELDKSEGKPDRLLLYIDQWEELYAQASSLSADNDKVTRHTADVNRFIDLLLNASQSGPVSVVATVRADFYDPLISHPNLRALLPTQQVLLGAMSRAELESTIVEPAKLVGLTFDPPQLVSRILDEAGEDEGMLPLLQYALKETWELRDGNAITAESYARSGGVREAIRLTAERTFEDLSLDDQQAARRLFLRLVTPGEGQEDTRARTAMPDEPTLRRIVDRFASPRTRLLVTGSDRASRPTVEVAHEALIRTWPRLRDWINSNREKLRARAAVVQAKADWERNANDQTMLLPAGLQLERALALLADPGAMTVDDVKAFVEESARAVNTRRAEEQLRERTRQAAEIEAANARADSAERDRLRQIAELEAAQARENAANAVAAAARRVARRTLAGLVTVLLLALAAIGLGMYARSQTAEAVRQNAEAVRQKVDAEQQRAEAEHQKAEAETHARVAERKTAEAEANFRINQKTESYFRAEQAKQAGADAVTAALLALEGLPDSMSTDDAERTRPFVKEAWHVLYGARLAQRERVILLGHTGRINAAVYAPDGSRILTASDDSTARLWDSDGKLLAVLKGHTGRVNTAVFAPDGRRILTASDDSTARLWDRDGKALVTLQGHSSPVTTAVFAPDDGRILTGSSDGTARLWDRNGKPLVTLDLSNYMPALPISSAVFAPDGGRLLIASWSGVRLWDRNGKPLGPVGRWYTQTTPTPVVGHTEGLTSAVFAPDGNRIVTSSLDKTARLWDRDGKPLAMLQGHTDRVESVQFSPNGDRILTASWDGTARLWDREGKPVGAPSWATPAGSPARYSRPMATAF